MATQQSHEKKHRPNQKQNDHGRKGAKADQQQSGSGFADRPQDTDAEESGARVTSFDSDIDDDAGIVDATEGRRGSKDSGMGSRSRNKNEAAEKANPKKGSTQEKTRRPGNEPH